MRGRSQTKVNSVTMEYGQITAQSSVTVNMPVRRGLFKKNKSMRLFFKQSKIMDDAYRYNVEAENT